LLDGVQLRQAGLNMLCELLRVVIQLLRVLHGALEQVRLQPVDLLFFVCCAKREGNGDREGGREGGVECVAVSVVVGRRGGVIWIMPSSSSLPLVMLPCCDIHVCSVTSSP
jgi:hypothetical protein